MHLRNLVSSPSISLRSIGLSYTQDDTIIMPGLKKIVESKTFIIFVGFLGCLIAAVIIFAVGVHVGLRKASYSSQWGQNYERNFIGAGRGMMEGRRVSKIDLDGFEQGPRAMMRSIEGRNFRNSHGIGGVITSISENSIVIKDRDNKENTVAVTDKTIIKSGKNDIKITELKNYQNIVVIGQPGDNGVVNADLIRVFN